STSLTRPPRASLFPYTTLFRSAHAAIFDDDLGSAGRHASLDRDPTTRSCELDRVRDEIPHDLLEPIGIGRHHRVVIIGRDLHGEDRKSTRLNSSHSQISYAVFC